MMVANSFDLWKKDSFFSAAEEVQESADIMESAYRLWERQRREVLDPEDLDELSRELQTALGTAKWQLDEFERAVRMSHGQRCNDNTAVRHMQFIDAIENQISHVEGALRETFSKEGKQPLRWVNLDEEERDDLAMFLSGSFPTSSTRKDESIKLRPPKNSFFKNNDKKRDTTLNLDTTSVRENSDELKSCKDAFNINENRECVIDIEEESTGTRDDIIGKADRISGGTRRTYSSPKFGLLKIVIPNANGEHSDSIRCSESTPKEKGSKPVFWKQRLVEHTQAKGAVNLFNQLFGGIQRHQQTRGQLQFNRSLQFTLVLMLTIFLIVPFVIYST